MSNREKAEALGMAHGTATGRLRKMILFSLVCQLGLNDCHQCGKKILIVDDLSIEHKEPWLRADDPVTSFFDLDNVAFSHLSCNSAAGGRSHRRYDSVRERTQEASKIRKHKQAQWTPEQREQENRKRRKKYQSFAG